MEVRGVYSRRELSKASIAPTLACAMRYDRRSSGKGISLAHTNTRHHQPVYLGSSLSNLRNRNLASGGISGGCSGFSSTSAVGPSVSSFLPSPFSALASAGCAFSLGRGVPARLG
ncbi:hypothetical protein IG631_00512 [Alternaria alternata]|nr:hypothetical protein IG631_00512 [Alternaria alternata]